MQWLNTSSNYAWHVNALKQVIMFKRDGIANYIYQVCMLYWCPDAAQNNKEPCKCQVHRPMLHAILMPRGTSDYSKHGNTKYLYQDRVLYQCPKQQDTVDMFSTSIDCACHTSVFQHVVILKTMPVLDTFANSACHANALKHTRIRRPLLARGHQAGKDFSFMNLLLLLSFVHSISYLVYLVVLSYLAI
jgi:hypothetical protein